jgi:hypothetical protein
MLRIGGKRGARPGRQDGLQNCSFCISSEITSPQYFRSSTRRACSLFSSVAFQLIGMSLVAPARRNLAMIFKPSDHVFDAHINLGDALNGGKRGGR